MARRYRKRSNAAAQRKVEARTAEIVVGEIYWLSSFYDKDGAFVKVHDTSTDKNLAGWNSTVLYEVVESHYGFYQVGELGTCNATNLYEKREDSSHAAKARSRAS